ncbi:tyrosine-type recombinase/integrase [Falsiroseomonas oryziterrae]|uniref:tyrosine-type recombinase/integrase n=1 Tax=Falsiroseomonas oryziterrae TaxID=2911368 RepID=UPI001F0117AF|nr:tyrosine-type recombinase/integrase [Roseomonas sp. NPKOSM-4]
MRDLLGRKTPAALDVSQGTLRAYRSSLRFLLRRMGLLATPSLAVAELPADWTALLDLLPNRFARMSLGGFAAFCGGRGIVPAEVDDAALQAFAEHLREADIRITAWDRARRAAATWNRAAEAVPGWPNRRLGGVQSRQQRYAPAFSTYPASLQQEIARFAERLAGTAPGGGSGLFTGDGPPVPLRPGAIRSHLAALRLAMAALVHTGTPAEEITGLAYLVEHRRRAIEWHYERAGRRASHITGAIASVLNIIAKYELKLTGEALRVILDDLRRAHPPRQREMTAKTAARLRELEDPARAVALVRLPELLIGIAAQTRDGWVDSRGVEHPPQPKRAAWLASIAVAIEILLHCPLRLSNLAALRLGVHLQTDGGRRGDRPTRLVVEPHEVKNGARIECRLPASTSSLIAHYVAKFRGLIAHPGSDWLLPSRDHADRPRDKTTLGTAITDTVHEHIGVRMNAHLFRAFAGALILEDAPNAIDDLRDVLGHKGYDTGLRHYRSVSAKGASQRLAALISRKRSLSGITSTSSKTRPAALRPGRRRR